MMKKLSLMLTMPILLLAADIAWQVEYHYSFVLQYMYEF